MILTSTLIAVDSLGNVISDPCAKEVHLASSIHVVAFSSHGGLLVVQSEGSFGIDVLEDVLEKGRRVCRGTETEGRPKGAVNMDAGQMSLEETMKIAVQQKIAKEQRRRESSGNM